MSLKKAVLSSFYLTSPPYKTFDPFLFCVYHKDNYPPGNEKMEAPRRGNGNDFTPSADYRMYHGDRIPGFPQHPHRGFETITATISGLIDHTDSKKNGGRYGQGDLQWMTAGNGIVHGENFPLINQDKPNPCRFFQIWLNLEAKNKMVEPDFVMQWAEEIPHIEKDNAVVTLWYGEYNGIKSQPSTKYSWANNPENDVAVWHIVLKPKSKFTIPPARVSSVNRAIYLIEGNSLNVVGDKEYKEKIGLKLDPEVEVVITNESSNENTEVLFLQGKPIGEPVVQHGPFVMNTREEIQKAFSDYQKTQFGGWPFDEDAVIYPREKGRFAFLNGKEYLPPTDKKNYIEMK